MTKRTYRDPFGSRNPGRLDAQLHDQLDDVEHIVAHEKRKPLIAQNHGLVRVMETQRIGLRQRIASVRARRAPPVARPREAACTRARRSPVNGAQTTGTDPPPPEIPSEWIALLPVGVPIPERLKLVIDIVRSPVGGLCPRAETAARLEFKIYARRMSRQKQRVCRLPLSSILEKKHAEVFQLVAFDAKLAALEGE